LRFVPLNKKPEDGTRYSIPGSMHLDDDNYWRLGMILTLYSAPNSCPQPIQLVFFIRKKGDYFYVKSAETGMEFKINPSSEEDFPQFFDNEISQIKDFFSGILHRYLEGSQQLKRIGFK
jgi:hypothetical protein